MADASSESAIQVKLPCRDAQEFRDKWAEKFSASFFIPYSKPLDEGTRVTLRIVTADGTVARSGSVVVVGARTVKDRPGLIAKFVAESKPEPEPELDDPEPETDSLVIHADAPDDQFESSAVREFSEVDTLTSGRPAKIAQQMQPDVKPPQRPAAGFAPVVRRSALHAKQTAVTAEREVPRVLADAMRGDAPLPLPSPGATGPQDVFAEVPDADVDSLVVAVAPRRRGMWLSVLGAVAVAGVAAVVVVSMSSPSSSSSSSPTPAATPTPSDTVGPEVARAVAAADARIAAGDLAGPGSALEHLLRARDLRADDPEVTRRLATLADKFEELGDSAARAGNLAEAATHYQATLLAAPRRDAVATKMQDIEDRMRDSQRAP